MAGKGSAKGEHRGGRKKGTPNKATAYRQGEIEQSGLTPLAYMLEVMRDEAAEPNVRIDAAKSAAPYVHPKLSTTELKHSGSVKFTSIVRRIVK
jgi:hypothetical protein